jgi:hypothetical protein
VLSPEEEFALTSGEHGHPEREGYGVVHLGGGLEAQMDEAPSPPEPETGS